MKKILMIFLVLMYACKQAPPEVKKTPLSIADGKKCYMLYEEHSSHDAATNYGNQIILENPGDWTWIEEGILLDGVDAIPPTGKIAYYDGSKVLFLCEDKVRRENGWYSKYMSGTGSNVTTAPRKQPQSNIDFDQFNLWISKNFPESYNISIDSNLWNNPYWQNVKMVYWKSFPGKKAQVRMDRAAKISIEAENKLASKVKSGTRNIIRVGSAHRRISAILRGRGFEVEETFFPAGDEWNILSVKKFVAGYVACFGIEFETIPK